MKYNVDYFINKFENIPENKWCTGLFHSNDNSKHCAIGHCSEFEEKIGLVNLIPSPVKINDGRMDKYQQPTPKQRILANLYDIKAKQTKKPESKKLEIKGDFKPIEFTKVIEKEKVLTSTN